MGAALAARNSSARVVYEEADRALGFSLSQLCFEGPAEQLELTEFAQPAILATSVAVFEVLRERTGLDPVALAGHSLGEWTALVVSEAVELSDALRAVRERGRLMQTAVPVGEGGMAAVLGAELPAVEALCAEAAGGSVLAPANLNGGGQIVVAGHLAAIDRLLGLARGHGVRAQKLPVSAPFHCSLMAPAAEGLRRVLDETRFQTPVWPIFTSVEGRLVRDGDDARELLARQVMAPVRWEDAVNALLVCEPEIAVEVGPGQALRGLMRRIAAGLTAISVGDPESLVAAVGRLV